MQGLPECISVVVRERQDGDLGGKRDAETVRNRLMLRILGNENQQVLLVD